MTKYFDCSFRAEGPAGFKENQNWNPTEPSPYPCEMGKWHWVNCRDGIAFPDMNSGRMRLVRDPTDSSRLCLMMIYETVNPTGDQNDKLYEVQQYEVPPPPETGLWYRCRYWFPSDFDVNVWRLIMQWGDADAPVNPNYPTLNIAFSTTSGMTFATNWMFDPSPNGTQRSFDLGFSPQTIPKQKWVNIAVYIRPSDTGVRNGIVRIKIDGVLVLDRSDICTNIAGQKSFEWGIGSYGGQEEAYGQYILFKDVVVSDLESDVTPTPGVQHNLSVTSNPSGLPFTLRKTA